MICKNCYVKVGETLHASHTPQLCQEQRTAALNLDSVKICQNHPRDESPALLLGDICVLCNPNISVKVIEPEILRAIKGADVIDPPPLCIY